MERVQFMHYYHYYYLSQSTEVMFHFVSRITQKLLNCFSHSSMERWRMDHGKKH